MNTLEAFHIRCHRQILDVCWWVHVSNAEVLQRSGLSPIGNILRHRRLSLFGLVHVWTLEYQHQSVFFSIHSVPAHDALRQMMLDTKAERPAGEDYRVALASRNVWLNKIQEDAGIVECLKNIDVVCNPKQFDVEADRKCIFLCFIFGRKRKLMPTKMKFFSLQKNENESQLCLYHRTYSYGSVAKITFSAQCKLTFLE